MGIAALELADTDRIAGDSLVGLVAGQREVDAIVPNTRPIAT
jgi:hypothetical protein